VKETWYFEAKGVNTAVNMEITNSHDHIIYNYAHRVFAVPVHLQICGGNVHVYVYGKQLLQEVVSPDPPS
jgi:hypothetical protein